MVSAFMVSYARAKSESLGFTPGTGMANVGLAPREVRIVILTVGLILAGILGGTSVADPPAQRPRPGSLGRPALAPVPRPDHRPRHHHRPSSESSMSSVNPFTEEQHQ